MQRPFIDNDSPFMMMCKDGATLIVKKILDLVATKDTTMKELTQCNPRDGSTPLYVASANGHTEVVALLLAHTGFDVNQATNDGRTPLLAASENGHTGVVSLLLARTGIASTRRRTTAEHRY